MSQRSFFQEQDIHRYAGVYFGQRDVARGGQWVPEEQRWYVDVQYGTGFPLEEWSERAMHVRSRDYSRRYFTDAATAFDAYLDKALPAFHVELALYLGKPSQEHAKQFFEMWHHADRYDRRTLCTPRGIRRGYYKLGHGR